ncbi:hypothetical protein KKJ06_18815 [Xenorhabdus bovienii]|uniref:hypothetical protein n=1 Tax=Xenorhabdus bovienii TaxID=40576 RepID=UPI00237CD402|nr:hypothetical protein [Xenorhabdus bovienii]MDE1482173.1 hypothetical protein [Xenorhabdus bovienii]MDE9465607.1 hypothetical protein [Xenorhabdus bovienii]MDE9468820.1 hypothetical protein [Xenorhabdus bovienii]MDE9547585.1 hypothetical protein [Xenorhabdus bovienii]MDE9557416.1 hypothetical protein [Xenorhabdus bovienii]
MATTPTPTHFKFVFLSIKCSETTNRCKTLQDIEKSTKAVRSVYILDGKTITETVGAKVVEVHYE